MEGIGHVELTLTVAHHGCDAAAFPRLPVRLEQESVLPRRVQAPVQALRRLNQKVIEQDLRASPNIPDAAGIHWLGCCKSAGTKARTCGGTNAGCAQYESSSVHRHFKVRTGANDPIQMRKGY